MASKRVILRIKHLRLQKDLTQDMICGKLGIHQNAYSRIESGATKLTVERLIQITEILNVSMINILSDESINIEI